MNPLDNLKDIHEPAGINIWPPAYGWWILALLTLCLVIVSIFCLIKYYKNRKVKRIALQALINIDCEQVDAANKLNQLLKRVALHYYPNLAIQQLYGEQWANFLIAALPKTQAEKHKQNIHMWQQHLYQKQPSLDKNTHNYKATAETWLKQSLPPSVKKQQELEQQHA